MSNPGLTFGSVVVEGRRLPFHTAEYTDPSTTPATHDVLMTMDCEQQETIVRGNLRMMPVGTSHKVGFDLSSVSGDVTISVPSSGTVSLGGGGGGSASFPAQQITVGPSGASYDFNDLEDALNEVNSRATAGSLSGAHLIVYPGTYTLTQSVAMNNDVDAIFIEGVSGSGSTTGVVIELGGTVSGGLSFSGTLKISNVRLQIGGSWLGPGVQAMYLSKTISGRTTVPGRNIILTQCTFLCDKIPNTSYFIRAYNFENALVSDCDFVISTNALADVGGALFLRDCRNLNIRNSTFRSSHQTHKFVTNSVYVQTLNISDNVTSTPFHGVIEHCAFSHCGGTGPALTVEAGHKNYVQVSNCSFYENEGTADLYVHQHSSDPAHGGSWEAGAISVKNCEFLSSATQRPAQFKMPVSPKYTPLTVSGCNFHHYSSVSDLVLSTSDDTNFVTGRVSLLNNTWNGELRTTPVYISTKEPSLPYSDTNTLYGGQFVMPVAVLVSTGGSWTDRTADFSNQFTQGGVPVNLQTGGDKIAIGFNNPDVSGIMFEVSSGFTGVKMAFSELHSGGEFFKRAFFVDTQTGENLGVLPFDNISKNVVLKSSSVLNNGDEVLEGITAKWIVLTCTDLPTPLVSIGVIMGVTSGTLHCGKGIPILVGTCKKPVTVPMSIFGTLTGASGAYSDAFFGDGTSSVQMAVAGNALSQGNILAASGSFPKGFDFSSPISVVVRHLAGAVNFAFDVEVAILRDGSPLHLSHAATSSGTVISHSHSGTNSSDILQTSEFSFQSSSSHPFSTNHDNVLIWVNVINTGADPITIFDIQVHGQSYL